MVTNEPSFASFGRMHVAPDEITRLSPHERLALIAQRWDSLEDAQVPLTTAQEAELTHRLATLDDDRAQEPLTP